MRARDILDTSMLLNVSSGMTSRREIEYLVSACASRREIAQTKVGIVVHREGC